MSIILVNEHTGKVVYLSPTVEGKTHDKRAADEAEIAFPTSATLGKDTGFQGYEPEGVVTSQPKKSPKVRSSAVAIKYSIGCSPARA
jgi:hypothetical protein